MASHSSDTAYYHLEKGVRINGPYPAEEPPSPSSLGLYSITDPVTLEGEITTPSGWDRMEIFDGGDLVATVDGVGANFSIPLDLDEDRNLNAVYAELVYPDGTRYTSHILWLVSREAPVLLDPPDDLSASAASVDAIALQWTDIANKESGYQLQRLKVEQLGDPVEVPAPVPDSGEWTYAPSVSGRQELSLEVTRRPDGATRVPVEVRHANGLTVTYLNQSNHGPVESSWDFRDEPDGNFLLEVADNGSNSATWSNSLSGTETNGGVLRLRSTDGATTWAGGGALGYNSGTVILEVTLDGWNAIGGQRDQSLEITFNTGNNNFITAGMVLQQNSSGFGLWGWALGSGSDIGSASDPVRQYPDSYDGPATFRVVADFDSRSYELLYKDPTTADSFVSGGTGTIDPGRDGGSIRMQVEGDWTDAGEYLDILRVRLLPPPPAAADDPVWVDLGVYEMQTDSTVSVLSGDTLGSVEAGTLRLVPFAESAWTDLPSLPADSSSFVDAGLEPGTTYRYRVRAVEGGNSGDWSNEAEATTSSTAESYSEWAQQFDWNGADDAPEATPLKDGMSNLLKFAFGGTPTTSAASLMPAIDAVMEGGEPVPVFSFRRRQGQGTGSPTEGYSVHGITYVVEVSPDLSPGSWVSGSGDLLEVDPPEDNGDGTETIRIRPAADLTTQPASFLRLRVEQP